MKRLTQTRFFGLAETPEEPPNPRPLEAAWYDLADSVVALTFPDEPFNAIVFTPVETTVHQPFKTHRL